MKKNNFWFTLIELMISITIFMILTMFTYANYAFYQNIARVKLSLKEISQSISTSRNMATWWYEKEWINQNIWILFEKNSNILKYYNFNYNSWVVIDEVNLIKEEKLWENVILQDIKVWDINPDKVLVLFSSIHWTWWFYNITTSWNSSISEDKLILQVSFKNANSFPLKRELKYNIKSYMSDY